MERRQFLKNAALASSGLLLSGTNFALESKTFNKNNRYRPNSISGFGGVALGNGFHPHKDNDCLDAMDAAWNSGVRYFDTSPWYGLGISERRMGMFLKDKKRDEYTLSTKIGRILHPHEDFQLSPNLWKGKMNFSYQYDYSAAGTRKSIEDSLHRLGVSSLDIVFIHDLSPDNGDMNSNWTKHYEIALKGAMPELTKMREEGLIKGWGLGVNTIEPIIRTIKDADPDIFLSACQYSLIHHQDLLNEVFPLVEKRDISIVVGAPLCAGFLAGKDRYLYGGDFPDGVKDKLAKLKRVADNHNVDLRTAALQFSASPEVVSGVIPGAHTIEQATLNAQSFKQTISKQFWNELQHENLIDKNAPIPL